MTPLVNGSDVVIGIGPSLVKALGADIPNLHEYPDFSRGELKVPVTPGTLWCWLRGSDLGDLLHVTRKVQKALQPAFKVRHVVDAFRHSWKEGGRGHEDACHSGQPGRHAGTVGARIVVANALAKGARDGGR